MSRRFVSQSLFKSQLFFPVFFFRGTVLLRILMEFLEPSFFVFSDLRHSALLLRITTVLLFFNYVLSSDSVLLLILYREFKNSLSSYVTYITNEKFHSTLVQGLVSTFFLRLFHIRVSYLSFKSHFTSTYSVLYVSLQHQPLHQISVLNFIDNLLMSGKYQSRFF